METISRKHIRMQLFLSTFYLSACTFGGGYVIVTLMKKKFVDEYGWIEEEEMLDLIAIAQSAPGAIAVNGAIVLGYKLAGVYGVMVAVLATIIPPFLIISVLSVFYQSVQNNEYIRLVLEGMQAGVSAVISSVVYDMGMGVIKERARIPILIMMIAFILNFWCNVSVIYIILGSGCLGCLQTWYRIWKVKR